VEGGEGFAVAIGLDASIWYIGVSDEGAAIVEGTVRVNRPQLGIRCKRGGSVWCL
jgi:hypothetical protein